MYQKFLKVLKYANKGIELDPQSFNVYLPRSVLFSKAGKLPEAIKDVEMAIKLNPRMDKENALELISGVYNSHKLNSTKKQ